MTPIFQKDPFPPALEKAFLAWLRTLPSWLSGLGSCEACHVKSVEHGSGLGYKPRLCGVPMTQAEHRTQSISGYKAALLRHARPHVMEEWRASGLDALEFFKSTAMIYRAKFLKELGHAS